MLRFIADSLSENQDNALQNKHYIYFICLCHHEGGSCSTCNICKIKYHVLRNEIIFDIQYNSEWFNWLIWMTCSIKIIQVLKCIFRAPYIFHFQPYFYMRVNIEFHGRMLFTPIFWYDLIGHDCFPLLTLHLSLYNDEQTFFFGIYWF